MLLWWYKNEDEYYMSLVLQQELPPLIEDNTGAIRVGNSRVLWELVIRAFEDGASPESIVQRFSTLSLSDVYSTISYYLRNRETVEDYLIFREELGNKVEQKILNIQPNLSIIRSRLLAQKGN